MMIFYNHLIIQVSQNIFVLLSKDVEKNCGLTGPHANDIVKMVNKMLATEWLSDVSQCLEETLEAGVISMF